MSICSSEIWDRFLQSGKRHLFLTGAAGTGKTTLRRALSEPLSLCGGIETWAVRPDRTHPPEKVLLRSLAGGPAVAIGLPNAAGTLGPCPEGFRVGAELLSQAINRPGEWLLIDEIGWLEGGFPLFQRSIESALGVKRVLACLRKQELPFLLALRQRPDVFIVDLDHYRA